MAGKATITEDEQAVKAVVRAEVNGMLNKDIDQLTNVIAPDAKLGHITGKVESREQWLNQIKSGRMRYLSNQEVGLTVTISDDNQTAQAVADNQLKARIFGFENTWPLRSTMKLAKRSGQWMIVNAMTTMF